jgi:hypothetical protein
MIMFTMMAFFGGFMAFLFYIIDISWVWGVPRAMCPVLGALVVIIGIAGALGSKVALGKIMESRRMRAMQSPEYLDAVAQLQALQPKILATQQEADRTEQQLRELVLGPGAQQ